MTKDSGSPEEIAEKILPPLVYQNDMLTTGYNQARELLATALRNGTLYVKEELEDEYAEGFGDGHHSHMREYKKLEQKLGEAKKKADFHWDIAEQYRKKWEELETQLSSRATLCEVPRLKSLVDVIEKALEQPIPEDDTTTAEELASAVLKLLGGEANG